MAVPDEDPAQLAVVAARLTDLRDDVRGLRSEVRDSNANAVSRGEWLQRNAAVDARFEGQGREISDLKAARAPWWSWAAVLVAVGSFAWSVLGPSVTAAG